MAPLLILGFKIEPVTAVGTDLLYMSVTKLFGAWQHHRQENVDYRLAALLAVGSVPGAIIGVLLLSVWSEQLGLSEDTVILRLLAAVLLVVGLSLIFFRRTRVSPSVVASNKRLLVPLLGGVVGFLVAVTSVGSGSLFLVLMVAIYALPLRRIVGTDIFHGFVVVAIAGLGHSIAGNVDYSVAVSLLIGSIPGVLLGSRLTMVISERKLGTAMGPVLLGVGIRLMV